MTEMESIAFPNMRLTSEVQHKLNMSGNSCMEVQCEEERNQGTKLWVPPRRDSTGTSTQDGVLFVEKHQQINIVPQISCSTLHENTSYTMDYSQNR